MVYLGDPAATAVWSVDMTQLMFVVVFFSPRSRQLELEDKQSTLELELRKFMELDGVYFSVHT